jgi:hypothetical protein
VTVLPHGPQFLWVSWYEGCLSISAPFELHIDEMTSCIPHDYDPIHNNEDVFFPKAKLYDVSLDHVLSKTDNNFYKAVWIIKIHKLKVALVDSEIVSFSKHFFAMILENYFHII